MKLNKYIHQTVLALGLVGLAYSGAALAQKDTLYVGSLNSVEVDGVSAGYSADTGFADRNMTFDNDIVEGQAVSMNVNWVINRGSQTGNALTQYPRTMNFTASSTGTDTFTDTVTLTGTPCAISSYTSAATVACTTGVSFTPSAAGTYQVTITPLDSVTGGSNARLEADVLHINFTVVEPTVELKDTKLTVDPQCVPYNGEVDLTATLEELLTGNKIPGATVDFYVDPPSDSIGDSMTDANGVATLHYNVSGLSAGDHNLYAEFLGDASYNEQNDSANLGIYYNVVGFPLPPINAEGNSIFGNGQVIPVKIRIADANNQPIPDAMPEVWFAKLNEDGSLGTDTEASSVSSADTGNIMRYVSDDDLYIYNMNLKDLTNGTYKVWVDLGDSDCNQSAYSATLTVAKKSKK